MWKKRSKAENPTSGAPKASPAVGNPPGRFIVDVLCCGSPTNSAWARRYSIFLPNSLKFLDLGAQIRIWGGYLQLKLIKNVKKIMTKSNFFAQICSYYDSGGSYHSKTCFYNSETIFPILNFDPKCIKPYLKGYWKISREKRKSWFPPIFQNYFDFGSGSLWYFPGVVATKFSIEKRVSEL